MSDDFISPLYFRILNLKLQIKLSEKSKGNYLIKSSPENLDCIKGNSGMSELLKVHAVFSPSMVERSFLM